MTSGSKILFIEDQRSALAIIKNALEAAGLIDVENGVADGFKSFNEMLNGRIAVAESFSNAFQRIQDVGDGSEYEWIFIDRNLGRYKDIEEIDDQDGINIADKCFDKEFFKSYQHGCDEDGYKKYFLGDYFYVLLINAGVPIEKIRFLTANSTDEVDSILTSPYISRKRKPEIIDKTDCDKLIDTLKPKTAPCAKIRYLYKDIFCSEEVDSVFGTYIEDFIRILAKRYRSEVKGKHEKSDGILLRNMIEAVVAYITDGQNFQHRISNTNDPSVRNFLNDDCLGYSRIFEKKMSYIHQNWICLQKSLGHSPSRSDEADIKNYFVTLARNRGIKLDPSREFELIIEYNATKALRALNDFYFKGNDCPPKYIFSYIDNIYTVTSEISAHGRNDKTTDGLSEDGWEALLHGMVQIMKWVAARKPRRAEVR